MSATEMAAAFEQLLLQQKAAEEAGLRKAAEDARRRTWTVRFIGANAPLRLASVSCTATQQVRFTAVVHDDDRLTDLLGIVRARLGLKRRDSVRLTHVRIKRGGALRMRPLLVEEREEEEEDEEEEEEEEEEDVQGPAAAAGSESRALDPLLMLRDVGLFRDNCTVVFETVAGLDVVAPPNRSQPRAMPDVRQQIRLRSYLKRRHRARWEAAAEQEQANTTYSPPPSR
jgi:hypothetical protein